MQENPYEPPQFTEEPRATAKKQGEPPLGAVILGVGSVVMLFLAAILGSLYLGLAR